MGVNILVDVHGPYLSLRFDYDQSVVEKVRLIPGRRFHRGSCAWLVPLTKEALPELRACLSGCTLQVAPSVAARLAEMAKVESLTYSIKTSATTELPEDMTFPAGYPPYNHQRTALKLISAREQFALFMQMGTGKTWVILTLLNWLHCKPSLVVCPASVMSVWQDQAAQFYPSLKVEVLSGSIRERVEQLRLQQSDIYVINYEASWRMLDALLAVQWKSITCDESHRAKGRATRQTKAILKLGTQVPRRYILSGTPMPNNPLELFAQFKFLDPGIFGPHFYAFRDRYAIMGGYQGYQAIGWKNMDELTAKLSANSYRVLKRDCLDLPDKVYSTIRLEMSGDQKKAYKDMASVLVAELSRDKTVSASVIISKLIKLREIASGFVVCDDGTTHEFKENVKMGALADLVEDLPEGEKMVIWCSFKREIAMAKALLSKSAQQWVEISGDIKIEDRGQLVERFQKDKDMRFLVGQQRAGGLGITLTAANNCVFLSNDYSPEVRLQAEDRLHRIGQVTKVTYYDLVCKGTIDTAIRAALRRKQNLSAMVTGDNVLEVINGKA